MARWLLVRRLILVRLRVLCVALWGRGRLGACGVCLWVGARMVMM